MKKIILMLLTVVFVCTWGVNVPASETENQGKYVLAFTGDQHGETKTYREWIETVKAVYGADLVLLSYSGDICDKNWDPSVFAEFSEMMDELMPGRYNVTTGNQEFKNGAPGESWDSLGAGYTRTGEAVRTKYYIVYNLGAGQEKMAIADRDIEQLSDYLAAAPNNIPIFVLSHYPLHLAVQTEAHEIPGPDGYRQMAGNEKLIEVLNDYPNVIFIWGHNHTFRDPRYGTIRPAGSKITCSFQDPHDKAELNFVYANYGSFCRSDTYGLIAEITPSDGGIHIRMYYVDADVPDSTRDSADMMISADGNVTTQVTSGTGIDPEDILAMSGYPDDPDFYTEY